MERVAALELDGQPVAFPFMALEREKVVNYSLNGRDLVVLFQPGHGVGAGPDAHRGVEGRGVDGRVRG